MEKMNNFFKGVVVFASIVALFVAIGYKGGDFVLFNVFQTKSETTLSKQQNKDNAFGASKESFSTNNNENPEVAEDDSSSTIPNTDIWQELENAFGVNGSNKNPIIIPNSSDEQELETEVPSSPQTKPEAEVSQTPTAPPAVQPQVKPEENPQNTEKYKSALNIVLTGKYKEHYNKAIANLSNSDEDEKRKLVCKVGLQILQSNLIKYERYLHFYSLAYTNSVGQGQKQFYSLTDAIKTINKNQIIYTDCFGYVRLVYSISAYSINPSNPEAVSGLKELYGYRGAYSTATKISSQSVLKPGDMIVDKTGGGKHVAIYLYSVGTTIVYIDETYLTSTATFSNGAVKTSKYNFAYVCDYI